MKNAKALMTALILILAVSGALQAAIPSLVGTWTGTGKAVDIERGFYNLTYTVSITKQNGNLFQGSIKITAPTGAETQKFTGIINTDNTIAANYREYTGEKATEAVSFGKYIPPTAKSKAKYEGYWLNYFSQGTGTLSLTQK